jgi:hypothetical protein
MLPGSTNLNETELDQVRAAVDKGIKSGDKSMETYERHFETKLRR